MNVDLTTVTGSASYDFDVAADDIDLDSPGVRLLDTIKVKCEIRQHLIETDVTGTVTGEAEIDCTRCLQPIRMQLDIPFDVSFVSRDAFPADKETELKDNDLSKDVLENDILDLKEVAREQILLNLPDRVFCKEDCKGLCPKCGANLNLSECGCRDDGIDPRWSALSGLK